jgi:inward rectifier potassium channel
LNDQSPIQNFSAQDLLDGNVEVLVLVKGTDETTQQQVHARRSYIATDIVWNARFSPIVGQTEEGIPRLMTKKIDEHDLLR